MSLLQDIYQWSLTLPKWQSDALARLMSKAQLSNDDHDDLLALLKAENGIPDSKRRVAKPLSVAQIPVAATSSTKMELLAIEAMQRVNAIANTARLSIQTAGLTVVYGDNGSGKSGYSRVLKRACRARDQSEVIYPNANLEAVDKKPAEADFVLSVNGNQLTVHWVDGQPSPDELSSLTVFDNRCARAYLDKEDDFSYVPFGLEVFQSLSATCNELKRQVDSEISGCFVDKSAFATLLGETKVGKLIGSLSAKTDPAKVEELATLTAAEVAEHQSLAESLKEADPKQKALQLRQKAQRVKVVATQSNDKGKFVSRQQFEKFKSLSDSYYTAKAASDLAANQFKENGQLLPGTGGEVWKELFDAAKKFLAEYNPDATLTSLKQEDPCPLCQQPLGEATSRLARFEEFVQQEAEKLAKEKRRQLFIPYKELTDQSLFVGLDDVTYDEVEALEVGLGKAVRDLEKKLDERRKTIDASIKANHWDALPDDLENPSVKLLALATKLEGDAIVLEQAADATKRTEVQKKFNELEARISLEKVKASVIASIQKMDLEAKLKKCLPSLRTQSISLKASELSEKAISKELEKALNGEFKKLGVSSLHVALHSRSERGKTLHKLKLSMAQVRNPGEILSEGEQRAVAIASFLAETNLSPGHGGIILDDPVSSLDHLRRERVARRLVEEGKARQVIIFTHDIYFLCVLMEEAEQQAVPLHTQSLMRKQGGYGFAEPELPFEGRTTSKRIAALRQQQQAIAKLHKDGDQAKFEKETIDAYTKLRMCWERGVEEVLLGNVVLRFRKGIETKRLVGVAVEDEDYAKVTAGMTKCSNYAHDKALIGGTALPEPAELLADIEELEAWRVKVVARAKQVESARK